MNRRVLLVGLLAATLASACGGSSSPGPGPTPIPTPTPTPPPPPPPTLGITRILSFGDSMTAGTTSLAVSLRTLTAGLPQSYPYKLQEMLTARYASQAITVLNAGRAGENATTGRNRLAGDLSEARPELLIVMEGANDLNSLYSQGLTDVGPVVNAIEDMVREAQGRGVTVIVATIPPQRAGAPKATDPNMLSKYNRDLRTMAAKKGAMLVDVNALLPLSAIGQDGLHPTEAGYDQLAHIFLDAIAAKWETPGSIASLR